MVMDYLENILQLIVVVAVQVLCLFQYMKCRRRGYAYLIAFFLCYLISTYYWTTYLLIMGDWPHMSDLFTYVGWNAAFMTMLALVLHMRPPASRRYFHPLMLVPIPLNLYQLSLYLPYGGALNNAYQVTVCTAIMVFSLQTILWHRARDRGGRKPWVAAGALLFSVCEFGMWTASCFGWPSDYLNPYYYFSFLGSLSFLLLGWAMNRAYDARSMPVPNEIRRRQLKHMKSMYLAVVVICCLGGLALGIWMREVLTAGIKVGEGAGVYDVIPVVLFICSMIIVVFAGNIIMLVNFGQKAAESDALRAAKIVAEKSNAQKSEFLANMSHEIRTPINAMLGMNEIVLRESLKARDLPPRGCEADRVFGDICVHAANIDSAGKNLLSIINDILDFSKIEAGKLEIVNAEYRLGSVLNDVSNMIAFRAQARDLDFQVDVDDLLPDGLFGDEVRVRQVITNLLTNAVKYTNVGSVRLSVKGSYRTDGGIDLMIAVKDTGIGIRPEDVDRLFDKFERVDLQRNSNIEGTGLGLAITRRLLTLMGGGIEVESVYGEGSTFTVTIPQGVVSREPVGDFQRKFEKSLLEARARGESFRAPGVRILVVDDTRMNIAVVTGLLKNTGMAVDTADSGPEAIALARENRYDLILMDQRMPEMDGTEAMRRVRAEGANTRTPVICVTADAVSGAREKYIAAGFDDYLTKPIDGESLERMLLKHLPAEKVALVAADSTTGSPERGAVTRSVTEGSGSPERGAVAQGATEGFEPLRAAGIAPEVGLYYVQGDADLYRTLLREYANGADEKARSLEAYRTAGDYKNYGTLAHALKSTSRMIGAAGLADLAERMEAAADAGDAAAIDREHGIMMAGYAAAAGAIRRLIGGAEEPAAEGDILEFLPEEG